MSENKFDSSINAIEDLFRSGDSKADEKLEEAANTQLIKDIIAAIGRDDLTAVGEMLAEDVRLEILGADELPLIREAKGRAHVLEALKKNFGAVQDQKPNIQAIIAQGDTVVLMLEEEGVIRATGMRYRIKGMQRFVIRDGKVEFVEEQLVQA